MRRRVVTVGQLAGLLMVLSLVGPGISQGGIFWQEDFESDLQGWGLPPGSTQNVSGSETSQRLTISTDVAHSGTHSLKCHYDPISAHQLTAFPLVSCGHLEHSTSPPVRDVYFRFYIYFVNFIFDSITTKHAYTMSSVSGNDGLESIWYNKGGSSEMAPDVISAQAVTCLNGGFDRDCDYPPNVNHVAFTNNRWFCVEGHVKAGAGTGAADGAIEQWIDGTQVVNYQNIRVSFGPNGAYDVFSLYGQYGFGDRYIDDIAVGDTRIGCMGAVSSQPSPNPPGSVTAR